MLDITTIATTIPSWQDTIQRGDVVLFRFPCAEDDASEAPKSRTCLVIEVETRGDRRWFTLAFGTSVDTRANVGDEIHVTSVDAMAAAGVRKPTRFVCARRVTVIPDHPGWDLNPRYALPVVGRLDADGLARMNAIRGKIHALRDIAIARRHDRDGSLRSSAAAGFTVEHRRSRKAAQPRKGARR